MRGVGCAKGTCILGAGILAAACAVGPKFEPPHEPVPEHYAERATPPPESGGAASSLAPAPPPAAQANAPTASNAPPPVPEANASPASNAPPPVPEANASPASNAPPPVPAANAPPASNAPPPVIAPQTAGESAPASFWWREFHDAELDRLVDLATHGNLDLKAAYVRIVEARLQVQAARAQGLPSLDAAASFTREQLGLAGILKAHGISTGPTTSTTEQQLISALERPVNLYQVGFDASWELDLFGKVRRSVEAANAQGEGAVEARNDALLSLEAEVAQTYFQLRAGQVLRRITLDLIAAQSEILELTNDRFRHGLSGEPNVDSARAQLTNLQSQLPPFDQTIATSKHALAVLTGQVPEAFESEFAAVHDLPPPPTAIPVGLPSMLARRRPDVRESEAALHAATAEIGVAVASLFPDVSLSGTFGLRNSGTRYLFDWESKFYTFGPNISVPIFQGGALIANVRLSRAQAAEAALSYRKVVLNALQEVEDGLTSVHADAARAAALEETVTADRRALDVDLDAYRHGLISYISVLTVELQAIEARQQLAQALLTQSTDLVRLYKALGGGWEDAH